MKKFPLRPLHDRVIVKADDPETITEGGIIIPESAREVQNSGVVMAAGTGTKDRPMELKAGDRVTFGKYAGTPLVHEDVPYLIMPESEILVVQPPVPKKKTAG